LILNTAEGARLHADLSRRFIELEMDIVLAGENLSDQQLRELRAVVCELNWTNRP